MWAAGSTTLGSPRDQIIEVATETRRDHLNPPDGPKALDRFMERAAGRDAQAIAADASRAKTLQQRNAILAHRRARMSWQRFMPPR
jgi:hypothetical protein